MEGEGLFQKVRRSAPHGLHRVFYAPLRGKNDHREIRLALENLLKDVEPIFRPEIKIQKNRIKFPCLQLHKAQLPRTGGLRVMALAVDEQARRIAKRLVVVDD